MNMSIENSEFVSICWSTINVSVRFPQNIFSVTWTSFSTWMIMFNNTHIWEFKWPMEVFKIRKMFPESLGSNSGCMGSHRLAGIVKIRRNTEWTWVGVGDRIGCLSVCNTSESSIDPSRIKSFVPKPTSHAAYHHRGPQIEQSHAKMLTLWVHNIFSIPLLVQPPDRTGINVIREGNLFPVMNSSIAIFTGPGKA